MNSGEPKYPQDVSMRQQALKGKEPQKVPWQSDQCIVSMKQGNACGEKALAGMSEGIREIPARHRTGEWVKTKLISLTQASQKKDPKYKFITLMYLLQEGFLKDCFRELKRDKSPGIDGVRLEDYEANLDKNLKDLVTKMKAWKYRPQPSRRVYIPKSDGSKRALGIPAIEDKVIQMAVKKILEAIFEVNFCDVSYGFRPKRSGHNALDTLAKATMTKPVNYVVDMDIDKFFDTINHKWLMKCLKQKIADPNFLRLIGRLLKAGVMDEGKYVEQELGTPQGAVLSPILANIYLHYVLDLWFEKKVKSKMKGFTQLIRYADDFVVLFQSGREAGVFSQMLKERLAKFGLKIAQGKSRTIEFGRYVWQRAQRQGEKVATFGFLGFTHYCCKTRKGKFKVGRKTENLRFRQKMKAMNLWLKGVRNLVKLKDWWELLEQKLIGHYNYYGISGNMVEIAEFYRKTVLLAHKWINRRSQKRSYSWEQFCRFLKYNPLPKPRIYHLTYTLSSLRGCIPGEPNARIGHVRFCEGH